MVTMRELEQQFRVKPGKRLRLKEHDPGWSGDKEMRTLKGDALKERAKAFIQENLGRLEAAQERLYANDVYSVLIILQAMDAAGKDGMIKHVMSGLNPQGCQVFSFKRPSDEELDHNFLWRYSRCLPERGRIGIFNRSYYEETLVVRVHKNFLDGQKLPPDVKTKDLWKRRYQDITSFERYLSHNGVMVLKFFLHISKEEQRQRFLARIDDPGKNWKFSLNDVREREHWDEYMDAYEDTIRHTASKHAPWYVVPADNKWFTRLVVASAIVTNLNALDLDYPKLDEEGLKALEEARKSLAADDTD